MEPTECMLLENRVAIVTGGASGIGRGIARRLGQAGVNTVVTDIQRDPKRGENYEKTETIPTDRLIVQEYDIESLFVETDVTDEDDVQSLVETTIDEFGCLDILVNNAGIIIPGTSQEISAQEWQQVIDVNLTGYFLTAKHAIPHLNQSDHGRIINVSSINAYFGGSGPSYTATKAGIVNLTRDLATEVADSGTTANAVLPGVVKTAIQDLNDEETMEREKENTLLPRIGEPEDVAEAVRFFASEEAEWITGSELVVDGGYLATRR